MQATTPPANVPGYRLTQFLGAGAFGQVWVGRDLNTGREVAVKFYLHRGGVNWSLLSREVKNLVQLSADRYVVQVLGSRLGRGTTLLRDGADFGRLARGLVAGARTPAARKRRWKCFAEFASGSIVAMPKGCCTATSSQPISCSGDDNEPRLADFGQSRLSDDQTPALGTLFYMAPEQAHLSAAPDASWDVYAVGAIMYRLLTGQPPYRADDIVEQLDTAGSLEKRLESLPRGHPREPRHRRGICNVMTWIACWGESFPNAWHPTRKDRYANVQQILQDLNRRDVAGRSDR